MQDVPRLGLVDGLLELAGTRGEGLGVAGRGGVLDATEKGLYRGAEADVRLGLRDGAPIALLL